MKKLTKTLTGKTNKEWCESLMAKFNLGGELKNYQVRYKIKKNGMIKWFVVKVNMGGYTVKMKLGE